MGRIARFCAVLIAIAADGCGIRTAELSAPPEPLPVLNDWRPAPDWVAKRLARAAPDVYFASGAHSRGVVEAQALARVVTPLKELLRDFPDLVVVLEGHCDDSGSTEFNRRLGERRADGVGAVPVRGGFPASHLRAVSFGITRPQYLTRDAACAQTAAQEAPVQEAPASR